MRLWVEKGIVSLMMLSERSYYYFAHFRACQILIYATTTNDYIICVTFGKNDYKLAKLYFVLAKEAWFKTISKLEVSSFYNSINILEPSNSYILQYYELSNIIEKALENWLINVWLLILQIILLIVIYVNIVFGKCRVQFFPITAQVKDNLELIHNYMHVHIHVLCLIKF